MLIDYKKQWFITENNPNREEIESRYQDLKCKEANTKKISTLASLNMLQLRNISQNEKMEILEKLKLEMPKLAEQILKTIKEKPIIKNKIEQER